MSDEKIIAISGGADPIHLGHLKMLKDAMTYGKVVFILNSDEWLRRKKGYVMMPWEERKEILMSIKGIHDVVAVKDEEGTVCEALERIKPDYFGNGGDRTNQNTPERKFCEDHGIELVFGLGGEKIQSSSELVDTVVSSIIKKLKHW